jgi:hypothetical protein
MEQQSADEVLFYDANRIRAGSEFDPIIARAINGARLFLLIVSPNSLLSKSYIMKHELPAAASAGLQIVPVILKACQWQGVPVPGKTRLGALSAVPCHGNSPKPVTAWEPRSEAWNAAVEQLREEVESAIRAGVSASPGATADEHPRAAAEAVTAPEDGPAGSTAGEPATAPLADPEIPSALAAALDTWSAGASALVVLIHRTEEDETQRYWDALRRPGPRLPSARLPLRLPVPQRLFESEAALQRAILRDLSESLGNTAGEIDTVQKLTATLKARTAPAVLLARPGTESARKLKAGVTALLSLVEQIDDESALHRLVVAIDLRDARAPRDALKRWRLDRFPRSRVLELPPPPSAATEPS